MLTRSFRLQEEPVLFATKEQEYAAAAVQGDSPQTDLANLSGGQARIKLNRIPFLDARFPGFSAFLAWWPQGFFVCGY